MLKFPPCGQRDGFLRAVQLLRHAGAVDAGRTHLGEHFVQPLQRAVQVQLDPAGGASHSLTSEGRRDLIIYRGKDSEENNMVNITDANCEG